jgi:uncharacterized membrane protein
VDLLTIALRIVHIVSAIIWVGGAALIVLYVQPAAEKLGPVGGQFLEELFMRRRVSNYFAIAATLVVIAGVSLYIKNYLSVATTLPALTFLVGGILGIIAWARGGTVLQKAFAAQAAAAAEVRASTGAPNPEALARLQSTTARLKSIGQVDLGLVLAAAVLMSVARYL